LECLGCLETGEVAGCLHVDESEAITTGHRWCTCRNTQDPDITPVPIRHGDFNSRILNAPTLHQPLRALGISSFDITPMQ
jgi:hypothetical protein